MATEPISQCSIASEARKDKNFKRRDTLSVLRITIFVLRRFRAKVSVLQPAHQCRSMHYNSKITSRAACILGAMLIIAALPLPGRADIFRFIDSRGTIHFTNVPTSSAYKLFIKEYPRNLKNDNITDRYDNLIAEASKRHNIPFPLLKAIIKAESNFNRRAVSKAGALGLMQIMPNNLKEFNVDDPFNPWENIMGGTRYLKKLLLRFNGKLPLALAAYNAGPGTVERYNDIPPIKETENYVEQVMKYYYALRK